MRLFIRVRHYIRKMLGDVVLMKRSLGGANENNEKDIILEVYCMKFLTKAEPGKLAYPGFRLSYNHYIFVIDI